jgi:hypothetical protein
MTKPAANYTWALVIGSTIDFIKRKNYKRRLELLELEFKYFVYIQ